MRGVDEGGAVDKAVSQAPESGLIFERGVVSDEPKYTVAIPTYNRPEQLFEAVSSAVSQTTEYSVDVIVVDNASSIPGNEAAVDRVALPAGRRLRYYRNETNIGMFPNWNRCISLTKSRYISILNDDDILHPDFIEIIAPFMERNGGCHAAFSQKSLEDRRLDTAGLGSYRSSRLKEALLDVLRFGSRRSRELTVEHLFWGNTPGNSAGLLMDMRAVRKIGGYQACHFPIADYVFHLNLSRNFRVMQVRDRLATVVMDTNESLNPITIHATILNSAKVRHQLCLEKQVPESWRRYIAPLAARQLRFAEKFYGSNIVNRAELESEIGSSLAESGILKANVARILSGNL